jgi:hypothetical protein
MHKIMRWLQAEFYFQMKDMYLQSKLEIYNTNKLFYLKQRPDSHILSSSVLHWGKCYMEMLVLFLP